ncbi:MAG: hypothetical protein AAGF79_07615 [Pseudomonadota bacterium]
MSDGAISKGALLESLHDIRLPAAAPGGALADLAIALGLAGLGALLVLALVNLVFRLRPRFGVQSLRARRDTAMALPEDARRLALLRLLREQAPEQYAKLSVSLYQPDGVPLALIEAEADRLV